MWQCVDGDYGASALHGMRGAVWVVKYTVARSGSHGFSAGFSGIGSAADVQGMCVGVSRQAKQPLRRHPVERGEGTGWCEGSGGEGACCGRICVVTTACRACSRVIHFLFQHEEKQVPPHCCEQRCEGTTRDSKYHDLNVGVASLDRNATTNITVEEGTTVPLTGSSNRHC